MKIQLHIARSLAAKLTAIFAFAAAALADDYRINFTPSASSNSFVLQVSGRVLNTWLPISNNPTNLVANRQDLTNLLTVFLASQTPTNFALYASLFSTNNQPEPMPFKRGFDGMWLKGIYDYGKYKICDVRFKIITVAETKYYDDILSFEKTDSGYYMCQDIEDPAVCFFSSSRSHLSASGRDEILATNWSTVNYFGVTNYCYQTNMDNPWVIWLPGKKIKQLTYSQGSTMTITKDGLKTYILTAFTNFDLTLPEQAVAAALHALINGDTNRYISLLHPDDRGKTSQFYQATPEQCVAKEFEFSPLSTESSVTLDEIIWFNENIFVTFRCIPGGEKTKALTKDWLCLKRYSGEWRIAALEDLPALGDFIANTCVGYSSSNPKVLPVSRSND